MIISMGSLFSYMRKRSTIRRRMKTMSVLMKEDMEEDENLEEDKALESG